MLIMTAMQTKCGMKWTQLPLTFCSVQKPEPQPVSPAPLTADHADPLADFVIDIKIKNSAGELRFWRQKHSKRIKGNLTPDQQLELEKYYLQQLEELDGNLS